MAARSRDIRAQRRSKQDRRSAEEFEPEIDWTALAAERQRREQQQQQQRPGQAGA